MFGNGKLIQTLPLYGTKLTASSLPNISFMLLLISVFLTSTRFSQFSWQLCPIVWWYVYIELATAWEVIWNSFPISLYCHKPFFYLFWGISFLTTLIVEFINDSFFWFLLHSFLREGCGFAGFSFLAFFRFCRGFFTGNTLGQ